MFSITRKMLQDLEEESTYYKDDNTLSNIYLLHSKCKKNKKVMLLKMKLTFEVSTQSLYLDVLNWPKDFSHFMYYFIKKESCVGDFIKIYILHSISGISGIYNFQPALNTEQFDMFFRDTFFKTNSLCGKYVLKIHILRDQCKYCTLFNKHK